MELLIPLLVGLLVAAAAYMMLSRDVVEFLFGLVLLSTAANLIIFAAGGLTWGAPPLIPDGADAPAGPVANALPQALVLTAIVIGFGLLAFALVLVYRCYGTLGTIDTGSMNQHDSTPDSPAAKTKGGTGG